MKKLAMAAAMTLAASGATAQYRPAPPVTGLSDRDDGRAVRVPVGGEIRVELRQQAGTPYNWQLRTDPHLRLIAEPTTESRAVPGVYGGPQVKTFRVRVVAPGRFGMEFGLRSASDDDDRPPERSVFYTVDAFAAQPMPQPGPPPLPAPDRNVKLLDERDANFAVSLDGKEAEIRLRSNASTGYRWAVVSARNVTVTRPPAYVGGSYRPGFVGGEGMTVLRVRNDRPDTDGYLTLGLIPPGKSADRFSAVKTIDYHFLRDR